MIKRDDLTETGHRLAEDARERVAQLAEKGARGAANFAADAVHDAYQKGLTAETERFRLDERQEWAEMAAKARRAARVQRWALAMAGFFRGFAEGTTADTEAPVVVVNVGGDDEDGGGGNMLGGWLRQWWANVSSAFAGVDLGQMAEEAAEAFGLDPDTFKGFSFSGDAGDCGCKGEGEAEPENGPPNGPPNLSRALGVIGLGADATLLGIGRATDGALIPGPGVLRVNVTDGPTEAEERAVMDLYLADWLAEITPLGGCLHVSYPPDGRGRLFGFKLERDAAFDLYRDLYAAGIGPAVAVGDRVADALMFLGHVEDVAPVLVFAVDDETPALLLVREGPDGLNGRVDRFLCSGGKVLAAEDMDSAMAAHDAQKMVNTAVRLHLKAKGKARDALRVNVTGGPDEAADLGAMADGDDSGDAQINPADLFEPGANAAEADEGAA